MASVSHRYLPCHVSQVSAHVSPVGMAEWRLTPLHMMLSLHFGVKIQKIIGTISTVYILTARDDSSGYNQGSV